MGKPFPLFPKKSFLSSKMSMSYRSKILSSASITFCVRGSCVNVFRVCDLNAAEDSTQPCGQLIACYLNPAGPRRYQAHNVPCGQLHITLLFIIILSGYTHIDIKIHYCRRLHHMGKYTYFCHTVINTFTAIYSRIRKSVCIVFSQPGLMVTF